MNQTKWNTKCGITYITVTPQEDMKTQLAQLQEKGFKISNRAKEILLNSIFPIFKEIKIEWEIAILRGSDWGLIQKEAEKLNFDQLPHGMALFIREKISDQDLIDMDLSFLLIANRIESDDPNRPYATIIQIGPNKYGSFIETTPCYPNGWPVNTGFAFLSKINFID